MFQTIQVRLQYKENSNTRSSHWEKTSPNGIRQDKSSQGMEDANKSQGSKKVFEIHKLLQEIYPEFQSYGKTVVATTHHSRTNDLTRSKSLSRDIK